MRDYIPVAIEIARQAAELQLSKLKGSRTIEYKSKFNIVTEVDKACEKLIVDTLRAHFPSHDILGEEGTEPTGNSDWMWIIDPIDGTVNYAHRYPLFSVSIGLAHKGQPVVGVVHEPNRGEVFTAEKGGGAFLNGEKIQVSKTKDVYSSLISTGFAYNMTETIANNLDYFNRFIMKCHAIRRDGVASVDLCYVACGRFDGFWEMFLKPWDIAAGALILEEAGGRVSMFDGASLNLFGDQIVASNSIVHDEMLSVLNNG